MQIFRNKFAILQLAALLICGCARERCAHGIPNFAQVSPGIYRGGQPSDAGWLYLKSLGVTNDVKLNLEAGDETAELLGMRIFRVPVSLEQQLGLQELPDGYFENLMVALPAAGTFFHCEHGQDRTGLVVAMWRVRWQGWTRSDAEQEMLGHGFHKELVGLWDFWRRQEWLRK